MTKSAEQPSIFVYGTLKRHGVRHHLWPYPPVKVVATRVKGSLFDLGSYPALAAEGSDWVGGERWEFPPEDMAETLQMLDEVEGFAQNADDLYVRRMMDCHDENDSVHRAYAYQFAQPDRLATARRILPNAMGICVWPD